jgi:hypothetical protein
VLAAIGFAFVEQRLHSRRRMGALIAVVMLLALEYASAPMVLTAVDPKVTSVYKTIRGLGPGIILELPLPALNRLPGDEAMYEFWSINHWNRLVNGYSGYYPPEYIRTVVRMRTFPDAMALSRLEALGVRYIVVHRAFFKRDEYGALLTKMVARPELKVQGAFEDALDEATLFELVR